MQGCWTITERCCQRDHAKKTFDDAVSRGETAGLLGQSEEASDVFSTSVGNIPAGETIHVEISYIGELKQDAEVGDIRFTIPAAIVPRFGYQSATPQASATIPIEAKGTKVTVDVNMADGSRISNIQSPSHHLSVSMRVISTASEVDPVMTRASATLSLSGKPLKKDFVLIVKAKDTDNPNLVLEHHSTIANYRAIMATLVPKFALPPSRPEIVFIVDRSGSMQGSNISMVVSAMRFFLEALPSGIMFKICSFGSDVSFFWRKSKMYDRGSLAEAEKHVSTLRANIGGTEILSAIKGTVKRRYKNLPLEMISLTDGAIWQQEKRVPIPE